MRNAHILHAPSLSHRVAEVRNKKQKLRNDILDFLEERKLAFPPGQVSRAGETFITCLVDIHRLHIKTEHIKANVLFFVTYFL